MRLLALDASSTNIGWVLLRDDDVEAHGTIVLKGDQRQRLCLTETLIDGLIKKHAPDGIAYEGPTRTFQSAIIAQQRVVGVILLTVNRLGMVDVEIAPAAAKKALTGKGNAKKPQMIAAAAAHLSGVYDEHAADALGVALAAFPRFTVGEVVGAM